MGCGLGIKMNKKPSYLTESPNKSIGSLPCKELKTRCSHCSEKLNKEKHFCNRTPRLSTICK